VAGACSSHGGDEKYIQSLIGKPEGKRPLGRRRYGWEDNVEREIGLEGVVWIRLA
jgi:hypothetical protein